MKAARLENLVVDAAHEAGMRVAWLRVVVRALHDDADLRPGYLGQRCRLAAKGLLKLADALEGIPL